MSESDAQAVARWLHAESQPTGILGDAGATSGGIFGSEPVASEAWDPAAHQRQVALERAGGAVPQQVAAHVQQALAGVRHQIAPRVPAPPPVRMIQYTGPSYTLYEGPPPGWPYRR